MNAPNPADQAADHPGVITPPPVIYGTGLIAGALIDLAQPLPLATDPTRWIIGVILIALGLALAISSTSRFRRAGTNVQPHKPSTTVVTTGIYAVSRNPIYLGLTALYVGLAFVANTWWAVILLPAVLITMRYGVIAREERYLEAKFGDAYTTYKARVRRWL
jgi:protein-S-isoprenylcysteine O-methyltransferase Ste14